MKWMPDAVWIERGEEDYALATRVRARAPAVPAYIVDDPRSAEAGAFHEGKRRLVIQRQRGTFLHHCPAGTAGMVCCNYLVVNFASNCPFDCSYCFLQEYLQNNPSMKTFTNVSDGLSEVDALLRAHPARTFRVGTGELADSLALDHLTDLSCELVPFFAHRRNAILELKTKSDCIENLLTLDPKERVVVSWSMNTRAVVAADESGTATVDERIAAAVRVQAAGYRLGFHFDPLIAYDGWETGYDDVIAAVFQKIDSRRVAWVSLGSLRMTGQLKAAMKARPQRPQLLTTELVRGPDGKERVWRGLRMKMYRHVLRCLRAVDPSMPLYICMEPAGVWEKIFGEAPSDREVSQRLVGTAPKPNPLAPFPTREGGIVCLSSESKASPLRAGEGSGERFQTDPRPRTAGE
jgi:spore photoproduct lyase